ncbi:MAG TPA: hypothetical protein VFU40_00730 [Gemmatimonadales bacterium]|nr:hypothetical protein [Gemmatimonadales bacterium]
MERTELIEARDIVRAWRRDPGLVFRTKSIIVAEGVAGAERGPLAALEAIKAKAETPDGGRHRMRK